MSEKDRPPILKARLSGNALNVPRSWRAGRARGEMLGDGRVVLAHREGGHRQCPTSSTPGRGHSGPIQQNRGVTPNPDSKDSLWEDLAQGTLGTLHVMEASRKTSWLPFCTPLPFTRTQSEVALTSLLGTRHFNTHNHLG